MTTYSYNLHPAQPEKAWPHIQTHNEKAKTGLDIFTNVLQIKRIYISFQTLCYETRNWAQVHPVAIDHPWDVSTTWLESTCVTFNWLDMIWKETHTCVYKVPQLTMHVRAKKQAMRSKELCIELRYRIVSRHRSGELYQKMPAALKNNNKVASIILKWKHQDSS